MGSIVRAFCRLIRYPAYLRLLWYRWLTPALVRREGIAVGKAVTFWGQPIVSRAPSSRIEIGDHAVLCSHSEYTALGVNHPVVLRTLREGAELRIGAGVRMSGATICAARRVIIGDHVVIGANVTITDTDFHALDPATRETAEDARQAACAPVEIGPQVFLGTGCLVLKGVVIGQGAVVGAGAVVTRAVPAHAIVAGNPARQIGRVPGAGEASATKV